MKIFIARVEQHIYPIIEDHWTNVKAFVFKEEAEKWARQECERIMHENFDTNIDDETEEPAYEWLSTDYGSSFTANFSFTENDENHFCCFKIDEQELDYVQASSFLMLKAKLDLAKYMAEHDCQPISAIVNIRYRNDGEVLNEQEIMFDTDEYQGIKEHPEERDDDYFFYCNGFDEFFRLLRPDNGEDFEITGFWSWL